MISDASGAEADKAPVRFEILDALRGFALLGVLFGNLRDFSLFNLLPDATRAALPSAAWDRVLAPVLNATVDAKFMTIFTILFGGGFALQMQKAEEGRSLAVRRYARRLLALLGIGLLHAYLFWWGDILRLYAVLGLLLIPFARLRASWLVAVGLFFAVLASVLLRPVMPSILPPIVPTRDATSAALAAFTGDSLIAAWKANATYDLWVRISAWGLPFYVLGRLLIGAALGVSGVLQNANSHLRFWKRLLLTLLPLGIVLTALILLRDNNLLASGSPWWKTESARVATRITRSAASLALGLGYIAAFVLLYQRLGVRRWLQFFVPVGRMALTNYLLQTLLGLALFYGVGFGVGPWSGLPVIVAIGCGIFALQVVYSHWWLARFAFGPCEWLWRCITYGRLLPIRLH